MYRTSQVALVVKNLPASAGEVKTLELDIEKNMAFGLQVIQKYYLS